MIFFAARLFDLVVDGIVPQVDAAGVGAVDRIQQIFGKGHDRSDCHGGWVELERAEFEERDFLVIRQPHFLAKGNLIVVAFA